MTVIGLIADTHVPDRRPFLHPMVAPIFQDEKVDFIIHAGDVSTPQTLTQLQKIAPIYAVKGNRDAVFLRHLPKTLSLLVDGWKIGITHGHDNLGRYIRGKLQYPLSGPPFDFFQPYLEKCFPLSHMIIFGHTHKPVKKWINGQLYFNPGSAATPNLPFSPSVGLLTVNTDHFSARHIRLDNFPKKTGSHNLNKPA